MNYINDENEIDLLDLFLYFKRKIWIIMAALAVCAVAAFLISSILITPMYTASTRVYVLNRSNENTIVYSDIQISSQFVSDYQELITGRNVTGKVISSMGLDLSDEQLRSRITVSSPSNTRILQIAVKDSDPQRAANIANMVREVATEQIQSIMAADSVRLVYAAETPKNPSSPNVMRNVAIGGVSGLVLAIAVLTILHLTDNAIRSEEDVERYLALGVLGIVPISKSL